MKKSIVVSLMLTIELVACVKPEKTPPYVSPTIPDISDEHNAPMLAGTGTKSYAKEAFF